MSDPGFNLSDGCPFDALVNAAAQQFDRTPSGHATEVTTAVATAAPVLSLDDEESNAAAPAIVSTAQDHCIPSGHAITLALSRRDLEAIVAAMASQPNLSLVRPKTRPNVLQLSTALTCPFARFTASPGAGATALLANPTTTELLPVQRPDTDAKADTDARLQYPADWLFAPFLARTACPRAVVVAPVYGVFQCS